MRQENDFLGGSEGEMMYHIRDARMGLAECSDKSCIWWLGGQMIAANKMSGWISPCHQPRKLVFAADKDIFGSRPAWRKPQPLTEETP